MNGSTFSSGNHPRSRKNLRPRKPTYGQNKVRKDVYVTPDGWNGLKEVAEKHEVSVSELVERIGRGMIATENVKEKTDK